LRLVLAATVVCVTACATAPATTAPATTTTTPVSKASDATRALVHASMVQRVVREAPAVTRAGVARLVTMVPLDEKRMNALAPIVSKELSVERLDDEVARRVEGALSDDERHLLADALARPDVARVIESAIAIDPANSEIESFVGDPKALGEGRRALVKSLVDVTWSPLVVDRLTRAPVAAAGKIVAAALRDGDDAARTQLLHIADSQRPGDPDALVVAFAFLWRDLDDDTLKNATAWFASDAGVKATRVLVDATLTGIDAVADGIAAQL
jgi:hypothetical protein